MTNPKVSVNKTALNTSAKLGVDEHPKLPVAPQIQVSEPAPEDVPKYQHYKCARTAMRLITTKGKKVIFTAFEFITADPDIIEYLDEEIKQGLNIIVKGALLTADDIDPMPPARTTA